MILSESYKKRIQELAGVIIKETDMFYHGGHHYHYGDKDAIPFFYYNDELYTDKKFAGETHWSIVEDMVQDKIKTGEIKVAINSSFITQPYEENIMKDTQYNGRMWVESKIISFWEMPENESVLKKLFLI